MHGRQYRRLIIRVLLAERRRIEIKTGMRSDSNWRSLEAVFNSCFTAVIRLCPLDCKSTAHGALPVDLDKFLRNSPT
ncbi:hypothetical protein KSP40_PGU002597 [Platanthera guangdongensis]|uniref:Uncharacterized protein n=1 Tax=Platanthera guangdongensis TaxID=2320717 RepID=A0ABR2MWV8_9ASPA